MSPSEMPRIVIYSIVNSVPVNPGGQVQTPRRQTPPFCVKRHSSYCKGSI